MTQNGGLKRSRKTNDEEKVTYIRTQITKRKRYTGGHGTKGKKGLDISEERMK